MSSSANSPRFCAIYTPNVQAHCLIPLVYEEAGIKYRVERLLSKKQIKFQLVIGKDGAA